MLVLAAGVGALAIGALAARILDGVTGDVYGAGIEVATVVTWLGVAAAANHDWLSATILT